MWVAQIYLKHQFGSLWHQGPLYLYPGNSTLLTDTPLTKLEEGPAHPRPPPWTSVLKSQEGWWLNWFLSLLPIFFVFPFILFFYSTYKWIMWYFLFSMWHVSLEIIPSRSTMCKWQDFTTFIAEDIPLCVCDVPSFLPIHLMMNI